ncbi:MAG: glycosyltransferase family 2 protein [Rhodospirillales bacterium]|nr:glycosyltransferase family 2 protein [Rhodospirillales bacterium]
MAKQTAPAKSNKKPTSKKALVSVVLSFRNEEDVIPELIRRLETVLKKESVDYELIFVNDDSTDGSLSLLKKNAAKNKNIKIINMSRRFGVSECVFAGIAHASGDAIITMDADLQDPPEVMPELIAKWRDGAEVVYTVRTHRDGEKPLKMWLTRMAYRAINASSEVDMPVNAGDFRLLSRMACEKLLELGELDPYPRGLVPWIGYRQEPVYYRREARVAGTAHFSLFGSLNPYKTFISGLTSFSMAPIFLIFLIGGGISALSLAVMVFSFVFGDGSSLWATFLVFMWGSLLFAIGFVGIYVGRTYKDVRGRPRYIVKDTIGFGE